MRTTRRLITQKTMAQIRRRIKARKMLRNPRYLELRGFGFGAKQAMRIVKTQMERQE
jgi:hypothetical protein